jgi:hypothetical protein
MRLDGEGKTGARRGRRDKGTQRGLRPQPNSVLATKDTKEHEVEKLKRCLASKAVIRVPSWLIFLFSWQDLAGYQRSEKASTGWSLVFPLVPSFVTLIPMPDLIHENLAQSIKTLSARIIAIRDSL